jgi:hypothetical protein
MTTLVTADLHLSDNPRDAYRHEWVASLPSLVEELDVQRVLILGDLCESKDRHSAWLVNRVVDHIMALAKICPVHILRGNHDYINEAHPFYHFLSHLRRVTWYNVPSPRRLRELGQCLFLPHTRSPEEDWCGLLDPFDWAFAHQTFEGADVGHGRKLAGVSQDIFSGNARIISGDVHVPQKLGPVTYVGAPYLVDFGDDYTPRIILLQDDEMESVPCSGAQKRLVDMGRLDTLESATNEAGVAAGDIVKFRVHLPAGQIGDWPHIQAEIRDWSQRVGCWAHTLQLATQRDQGEARIHVSRSTQPHDDRKLVENYGSQQGADKKTIRTGIRLLEGSE